MITQIELFGSTNSKALWMVIKRDKLFTVNLISIQCLNKKICSTEITNLLQFIINVRKSHRQPQCTLQLVCESRVLFVWVDLHVSLRGQQHPKCEREIRLVCPPFFCKVRSSSNPHKQKSEGFTSADSNSCRSGSHSELHTRTYDFF
jgi:hypothetical protein